MVKKKISGQTIAIIALALLLLLTVGFGGVYAYYSAKANQMSGKVVMANLTIGLLSERNSVESGKSEIVISSSDNILPDQELDNSALLIHNETEVPIHVIVVYRLEAVNNETKEKVVDDYETSLIEIGANRINEYHKDESAREEMNRETDWIDYVYTYEKRDGTIEKYRCLVSTATYTKQNTEAYQRIEVIEEKRLKLHREMGNAYKNSTISFVFQAYAIGAASLEQELQGTTPSEKCKIIVDAIYAGQEYRFLQVSTTV